MCEWERRDGRTHDPGVDYEGEDCGRLGWGDRRGRGTTSAYSREYGRYLKLKLEDSTRYKTIRRAQSIVSDPGVTLIDARSRLHLPCSEFVLLVRRMHK